MRSSTCATRPTQRYSPDAADENVVKVAEIPAEGAQEAADVADADVPTDSCTSQDIVVTIGENLAEDAAEASAMVPPPPAFSSPSKEVGKGGPILSEGDAAAAAMELTKRGNSPSKGVDKEGEILAEGAADDVAAKAPPHHPPSSPSKGVGIDGELVDDGDGGEGAGKMAPLTPTRSATSKEGEKQMEEQQQKEKLLALGQRLSARKKRTQLGLPNSPIVRDPNDPLNKGEASSIRQLVKELKGPGHSRADKRTTKQKVKAIPLATKRTSRRSTATRRRNESPPTTGEKSRKKQKQRTLSSTVDSNAELPPGSLLPRPSRTFSAGRNSFEVAKLVPRPRQSRSSNPQSGSKSCGNRKAVESFYLTDYLGLGRDKIMDPAAAYRQYLGLEEGSELVRDGRRWPEFCYEFVSQMLFYFTVATFH